MLSFSEIVVNGSASIFFVAINTLMMKHEYPDRVWCHNPRYLLGSHFEVEME